MTTEAIRPAPPTLPKLDSKPKERVEAKAAPSREESKPEPDKREIAEA